MQIVISNEQEDKELSDELLKKLQNVLELAGQVHNLEENCEVSVTFVEDEEIQFLNREYRNIDSVTDVLSFALDEGENFPQAPGEHLLGDIIISVPRAALQAKDYNHSLERELAYLLIHGFLHLLGYDHMQEDDKAEMRAQEELILEKLNISRDINL